MACLVDRSQSSICVSITIQHQGFEVCSLWVCKIRRVGLNQDEVAVECLHGSTVF